MSDRRVIGRVTGRLHGPLVIGVGGLHGDEPAGLEALDRVLERLAPVAGRLCGEFVAVAGNLGAIQARSRFVDRDLNRGWMPDKVTALADETATAMTAEDAEQLDLLRVFDRLLKSRADAMLLDLHTTSGRSTPFAIAPMDNDATLGAAVGIPIVHGLTRFVTGTLVAYTSELGVPSLALQGGQHDDASSATYLAGIVLLVMRTLGMIKDDEVTRDWRSSMAQEAGRELRGHFEVTYVHRLKPGRGFQMVPGMRNFQEVRAGDVIAHDMLGPVVAPHDGRLLLPLYREHGEEGFFLVRSQ